MQRLLLLIFLCLLVILAVYLWTVPMRSEHALQNASFLELHNASKHEPNNPRIFYYLGLREQKLGQIAAARDAFAHAAQIDVDNENSWLAWAATAGATQGDGPAFGILSTFLKNHPNSARAHLALAQFYHQKHAHQLAYAEAAKAAALNPRDTNAWQLAGTEAFDLKHYSDSEAAMRQAAAMNPKDWRTQVGLGNALMELKQEPEALGYFQNAIGLAPNEGAPALALGKALLDVAATPVQRKVARQTLTRAIMLRPDLSLGYELLGECDEQEGYWLDAKQAFVHAEGLAPDDAKVHFELANVYRRLGETKAAAQEADAHSRLSNYRLKKISLADLALATGNVNVMLKQARLLSAHGEYPQAADTYRGILARDPKMQAAQRELGNLQKKHPNEVVQTVNLPMPTSP